MTRPLTILYAYTVYPSPGHDDVAALTEAFTWVDLANRWHAA